MVPYLKFYVQKNPDYQKDVCSFYEKIMSYQEYKDFLDHELMKYKKENYSFESYQEYVKRVKEGFKKLVETEYMVQKIVVEEENDSIIQQTEKSEYFVRWLDKDENGE